MDDERLELLLRSVMDFGEASPCYEDHLAELESAVGALKAFVAARMFPDEPQKALNQLQTLEKTLFNSDPRTAQRKIMQEAPEALQQWRRTGVPLHTNLNLYLELPDPPDNSADMRTEIEKVSQPPST